MKKKIFWISLFMLISFGLLVKIPIFEMRANGDVFYYKAIKKPISVILEHEHSVSKNRLIEYYEVQSGHIILKETIFKDHGGAGMPDVPKEDIYLDDLGIHYLMNEDFNEEIAFMIYPLHLWRLTVSNHVFDFSMEEDNSEIMMVTSSESILLYFYKRLID